MLKKICAIFFLSLLGFSVAHGQEQKEVDVYQQAEEQADRLQRLLDLEDWQVFYVDSTLKHDIPAMRAEIQELSAAKVSNTSMYLTIQDRWMEKIDSTYKTIFTEEQWKEYLKSGAAKYQKQRQKRRERTAQSNELLHEKKRR